MQWLFFCLQALARQQPVILASTNHCPPPLQLPIGPMWAGTLTDEAGYKLPGRPQTELRQAARNMLRQTTLSQQLSIPLNPWTGDNDPKHNLRLHLRKLSPADLPRMMLLDGKLRIGQSCAFDVDSLDICDNDKAGHPITVQARHMHQQIATFAPTPSHVAVFGAGALAHQVVNLLSDSSVTVHWEAAASERMPPRQAANVLTREPVQSNSPQSDSYNWLPANTHGLVMTHDHPLDIRLCASLAQLPQINSVGMVGSKHKRKRLYAHLEQQQLTAHEQAKIRCPIGGANSDNLNTAALNIAHEIIQLTTISTSGLA